MGVGNDAGSQEIDKVKILLALGALVGSVTLLLSEWAGQALAYL
jgi:hypothetical protein